MIHYPPQETRLKSLFQHSGNEVNRRRRSSFFLVNPDIATSLSSCRVKLQYEKPLAIVHQNDSISFNVVFGLPFLIPIVFCKASEATRSLLMVYIACGRPPG